MKITFLGGAGTVTGSKYLLETGSSRILIDCGLFQGYKWLRRRNWQPLPFAINKIDAVVLTHAHLDHSGYLPVLYQQGFRRPVYCQQATSALCGILLPDSGHIQEEDAKYYSRHKLSRHSKPLPLYDRATAEGCLELLKPVEFDEKFTVGEATLYLQYAGHILGAGSLVVEAEGKRVGFSGDVGRPDDILMNPPQPLPELDLLLLEATYGNRRHESSDPFAQLADIVNKTAKKGGVLLVPSFAVGRAQALQHILASLIAQRRIPEIPIYLDSPMAISVSDIYCRYARHHRLNREQCHRMCEAVTYTRSVEESKALSEQHYPHVIIAGSGMATGGRILHHFKRLLGDQSTSVVFCGYQAEGTRGAKMLNGAESVKIHGEWFSNRAQTTMLHGLSGHGDYLEIHDWLQKSALQAGTRIRLVHGSPEALDSMRDYLRRMTGFELEIAADGECLEL